MIAMLGLAICGKSFRFLLEQEGAPALLATLGQACELVERIAVALGGEEVSSRPRMLPGANPDGLAPIVDDPQLIVGGRLEPAHRLAYGMNTASELDRFDQAVRLGMVTPNSRHSVFGHRSTPPVAERPSTRWFCTIIGQ